MIEGDITDEARTAIECIERAFAGVQLEDGVSLHEADVIDDYGTDEQRMDAREQDELDDWRRIPEEEIDHHHSSLAFFDTKGLRFHIPAYMRFVLRHYNNSASPSIVATISMLGSRSLYDVLTPTQRDAVRQFLRFMAFNVGIAVDRHAKQILEERWMETQGDQ